MLSSCQENWDDPIPEWAELGEPTLRADINEDGFVVLQWGNFRITQGCMDCVPWVEASSYDIFVKKPGEQNFERLVNLELGTREFLINTGDKGSPYEFYIRANRAGRTRDSNIVMIVPPVTIPEEILIFRPKRIRSLLLHPQVSPKGDKIAFTADSTFIEEGQPVGTRSLFVWDMEKQERTLIRRNARHANWSSDGRFLIYTTNDGLESINSWHIPSHS